MSADLVPVIVAALSGLAAIAGAVLLFRGKLAELKTKRAELTEGQQAALGTQKLVSGDLAIDRLWARIALLETRLDVSEQRSDDIAAALATKTAQLQVAELQLQWKDAALAQAASELAERTQQFQARIAELEAKVATQQTRISGLEAQVGTLSSRDRTRRTKEDQERL